MIVSNWRALTIAFLLPAFCFAGPRVPTPATQALLDANPGLRGMTHGEHLVALYGVPFATDSDPATTTDEFVEAFLTEHADAFGVNGVTLALKDKINIRNDKFTVYTYLQTIDGLPVHGSAVKIPVLLGETERIGYCRAKNVGCILMHLLCRAKCHDSRRGASRCTLRCWFFGHACGLENQ